MSTSIQVMQRFIERSLRPNYAHQFFTSLGGADNSAYRLPSVAPASVITTQGRAAPTRPTVTSQSLLVDQRAKYNHAIDDLERRQLLGGAYTIALADRMYKDIMGQLDDAAYAALVESCVANSGLNTAAHSGGNVYNKSLASLDRDTITRAEAGLQGNGNQAEDFMYFASPLAYGLVGNLFRDQITDVSVESPQLGVTKKGFALNSIPVIRNYAMPDQIEVSASASTIASNIVTATVPSGHPLQVDMKVYTTGGTANVSAGAEATITAAGDTSVTFALTGSDGANGAMTIICPAAVLILVPRDKLYWAGDKVPNTRLVADAEDAGGDALQAFVTYGREVIDGDTRMILVP